MSKKELYKLDRNHEWMKIISNQDITNPSYHIYKNQKKRLTRLIKYIDFNKEDRVADFACGNGVLLDLIYNKVFSYDGIDFSEDFIQLAKKRKEENGINNAKFYSMDILEFCKDKIGVYDKAFAMDFSEHISDDEFVSIFRSIKRTLKDNGKLYIHTPNGDYLLEIFKKLGLMKKDKGHIGIRNDEQYIYLLRKIDNKNIKIKYLAHYLSYLSIFHFLSYIPFFGKYFKARLFIECS